MWEQLHLSYGIISSGMQILWHTKSNSFVLSNVRTIYETTSSGMQILYYGMELLVPQHKICIQEIVVPFCPMWQQLHLPYKTISSDMQILC